MQLPMVSEATMTVEKVEAPVEPEPVKRKSNEVEGFTYVYWKQAAMTIGSFTGYMLLIPFWPFIMAYQTGEAKYALNYFGTLFYFIKMIPTQLRHRSMRRMARYNLLMTPAQVEERIGVRQGACTRCGKCCNQLGCLFLGKNPEGQTICTAYGSLFWYYGTCGRYPLTQQDIDDHACPGFSFKDEEGKLVYEV